MPSSKPPQFLSIPKQDPVRSGGDSLGAAAGKPILGHCESPTIALAHARAKLGDVAWIRTAIYSEESGSVAAFANVPGSASTADCRADSLGMSRPSRRHSLAIPNIFPNQRSPYAVA